MTTPAVDRDVFSAFLAYFWRDWYGASLLRSGRADWPTHLFFTEGVQHSNPGQVEGPHRLLDLSASDLEEFAQDLAEVRP